MSISRVNETIIREKSNASSLVTDILTNVENLNRQAFRTSVVEKEGFINTLVSSDDDDNKNDYVEACMTVYADIEGEGGINEDSRIATEHIIGNSVKNLRNLRHRNSASIFDVSGHNPGAAELEGVGEGGLSWGLISNYGHLTGPVIAATLPTSFASQVFPITAMDQPRTTFQIDIRTVKHANGTVCRLEDFAYYMDDLGAFGESAKVKFGVISDLNDDYVIDGADEVAGKVFIKSGKKVNFVMAAVDGNQSSTPYTELDIATFKIAELVFTDLDGTMKSAPVVIRQNTDFTDSRSFTFEGITSIELSNKVSVKVFISVKILDIDTSEGIITTEIIDEDTFDINGLKTAVCNGIIPTFAFRNNVARDKMSTMSHYQNREQLMIRSAPLVNIPLEPQHDEDSKNMGFDRVARQIETAKQSFGQSLERRGVRFMAETIAAGIGSGIFSEAKGEGGHKDFITNETINLATPDNILGENISEWAKNYFGKAILQIMSRARATTRERDVTWYFVTDFTTMDMLPGDRTNVTLGAALGGKKYDINKGGIQMYKQGDGNNAFFIVGCDLLSINENNKNKGLFNTLRGSTASDDAYDNMNNGVMFGVAIPNGRGETADSSKTLEYITYSVNMVEGVVSSDGINPAINIYNRDMFVNFRPIVAKILVKGIGAKDRYRAAE